MIQLEKNNFTSLICKIIIIGLLLNFLNCMTYDTIKKIATPDRPQKVKYKITNSISIDSQDTYSIGKDDTLRIDKFISSYCLKLQKNGGSYGYERLGTKINCREFNLKGVLKVYKNPYIDKFIILAEDNSYLLIPENNKEYREFSTIPRITEDFKEKDFENARISKDREIIYMVNNKLIYRYIYKSGRYVLEKDAWKQNIPTDSTLLKYISLPKNIFVINRTALSDENSLIAHSKYIMLIGEDGVIQKEENYIHLEVLEKNEPLSHKGAILFLPVAIAIDIISIPFIPFYILTVVLLSSWKT